jgi:peptide/nickel transport system permease protein
VSVTKGGIDPGFGSLGADQGASAPVGALQGTSASLKRRRPVLVYVALTWLVLVVIGAIIAPLLPIANPTVEVGPSRLPAFSHWPEFLGTDDLGRSELSRLVYGARVSLMVGLGSALIGMVVGVFFGLLAGHFRGRADTAIAILTDSFLVVPPLVLLLSLSAILSPSVRTIIIGLSCYAFPTFVRLTRANTLSVVDREFVTAARAIGTRPRRIIFGELLPNVLPPVLAYVPLVTAVLIIAEASLSFLGLGIRPPTPTWGNMIADGQPELRTNPELVFLPAAFLFATIYSINVIGEWLRARFNPSSSKL